MSLKESQICYYQVFKWNSSCVCLDELFYMIAFYSKYKIDVIRAAITAVVDRCQTELQTNMDWTKRKD